MAHVRAPTYVGNQNNKAFYCYLAKLKCGHVDMLGRIYMMFSYYYSTKLYLIFPAEFHLCFSC